MATITDTKVAILVYNYFEQAEFTGPLQTLKDAGVTVEVIGAGAQDGQVQGVHGDINLADTFTIDKSLDDANIDDYDALILPGGTINADNLRTLPKAKDWVKAVCASGKPLAAICHAPWVLISSAEVAGKNVTSYPSLQDDLQNAGANWLDQEVVIDENIITSRNPDDVPAFCSAIVSALEAL